MNSKIFIDTSAFYALIDRSDVYHTSAKKLWIELMETDDSLITSNYVVSETAGLLQIKIGFDAAKRWYRDVLGVLEVKWVDQHIHQRAYEIWLNLGTHKLSLEDCITCILMRQHQMDRIFCFKQIFAEQGMFLLPALQEAAYIRKENRSYQQTKQSTERV